ncbi:hypothetical protein JOF57_004524 [Mycolicibacterium lutetiense]|uniref:Uncharacterized protein n=1 Tax=Mycolicibacterium lutetiense TaxID=1641992 RepID=A0ABS4ZYN6_9MYCO|nr:hypothetical protein [Mycolicibacterium lutetiense]
MSGVGVGLLGDRDQRLEPALGQAACSEGFRCGDHFADKLAAHVPAVPAASSRRPAPTVTISGTVVDAGRVAGKPLHRQDTRKGGAPPHTVSLPAFGVQVLADLYAVTGQAGAVFANRDGGLVA